MQICGSLKVALTVASTTFLIDRLFKNLCVFCPKNKNCRRHNVSWLNGAWITNEIHFFSIQKDLDCFPFSFSAVTGRPVLVPIFRYFISKYYQTNSATQKIPHLLVAAIVAKSPRRISTHQLLPFILDSKSFLTRVSLDNPFIQCKIHVGIVLSKLRNFGSHHLHQHNIKLRFRDLIFVEFLLYLLIPLCPFVFSSFPLTFSLLHFSPWSSFNGNKENNCPVDSADFKFFKGLI